MRPTLFTFDIFGTVVDWRRGLIEAVRAAGLALDEPTFDRVIDAQAEAESGPFRRYAEIVAESLVRTLGIRSEAALAIGAEAGRWPLYPDSAAALRSLQRIAPCVATTNSDRAHGEQVQAALGFRLSGWVSAEEIRRYKPDPDFWRETAARVGVTPGPHWWHVSAYGDYDLGAARALGLTCVFVARPHARPGPAEVVVNDLADLASRMGRDFGPPGGDGPSGRITAP